MTKTSKAQFGVGAATTPATTSKPTRNRRPVEEKHAELKRRLHDIDDLILQRRLYSVGTRPPTCQLAVRVPGVASTRL